MVLLVPRVLVSLRLLIGVAKHTPRNLHEFALGVGRRRLLAILRHTVVAVLQQLLRGGLELGDALEVVSGFGLVAGDEQVGEHEAHYSARKGNNHRES